MKKTLTLILALAVASVSFAGSISRGGGSFSRSSPSFSRPAQNLGMQRPSVVPSKPVTPAMAPKPTYTPPSARTNTYAPPPTPTTSHTTINNGGGGGGGFMSSFGGSFLGSMLGTSIATPHAVAAPVVAGGGVVAATPGGAMVAPAQTVIVEPTRSAASHVWGWFFAALGLVALAALIWFLYRVVQTYRADRKLEEMEQSPLPFGPVSMFLSTQTAFGMKDQEMLSKLLTDDMVDMMINDMPAEPTPHKIHSISYTVVDRTFTDVSIHYRAKDAMDDSDIDEVWHFTHAAGAWRLSGISQV